MTSWDEMRSLIEAGWHSGWGKVYPERFADIDTKQAQHDGERQIYGGMFSPQEERE